MVEKKIDYEKLFMQFYIEYQATGDFQKIWERERDCDKYAKISSDFIKWLLGNGFLLSKPI